MSKEKEEDLMAGEWVVRFVRDSQPPLVEELPSQRDAVEWERGATYTVPLHCDNCGQHIRAKITRGHRARGFQGFDTPCPNCGCVAWFPSWTTSPPLPGRDR